MVRITEHLGYHLPYEPISSVRPSHHIRVDTADLGESEVDSTSSNVDSFIESAPF